MIRIGYLRPLPKKTFPHTRGDDPIGMTGANGATAFSPHPWG